MPPDLDSNDAATPCRRLLKRRSGFMNMANESFAMFIGAVTEDIWTKCILRKTLAGCAPGYEINVHGAQTIADEPRLRANRKDNPRKPPVATRSYCLRNKKGSNLASASATQAKAPRCGNRK